MEPEIEVRAFKEIDLAGGPLVVCVPSVGDIGPIAGSYIVGGLELDQVCALESAAFPPTSMIYANKPKFPVRVYASTDPPIAVLLGEFLLDPLLARPLAYTVLDWADRHDVARIFCLEGFPSPGTLPGLEDAGTAGVEMGWGPQTWKRARQAAQGTVDPGADRADQGEASVPRARGVASIDEGRDVLDQAQVPGFGEGIVTGIAGVLLNEGRWRGTDVIALLAEARPDLPDARAAASVLATLDEILDEIEIDLDPLYERAAEIEALVKKLRLQALPAIEPGTSPAPGPWAPGEHPEVA